MFQYSETVARPGFDKNSKAIILDVFERIIVAVLFGQFAIRLGLTQLSLKFPPFWRKGSRHSGRDFRKRAHWSKSDDAASRTEALDVRIALSGKLLWTSCLELRGYRS